MDDDEISLPLQSDLERFRLLERGLDEVGGGPFHWMMMGVAAIGFFIEAAEMQIVGLLYPAFLEEWRVAIPDLAIIKSFSSIGMVVGCLAGGGISDVVGRKKVYSVGLGISSSFGLLSANADGPQMFAVMRLFVGLGYGFVSVTAIPLLLEFAPSQRRGFYTAIKGFAWCLGSTSIILLAWALMEQFGWRCLVRASAILGIPAAIVLILVAPESIRFSILNRDFKKVIESFKLLCRMNGKRMPRFMTEEILRGEANLGRTSEISTPASSQIRRLFMPKNWATLKPLILIWILNSAGTTILGFLPLLLKQEVEGQNIEFKVAMMSMVGEWIGSLLVAFLTFRLERRTEMRLGQSLTGLAIIAMPMCDQNFAVIAFFLMVLRIGLAMTNHGLFTYTPEVFPTKIRVLAFGVCQTGFRLVSVFSPYFLTSLNEGTSFEVTSTVHGAFFLIAGLLTFALQFETRGAPLVEQSDREEIENDERQPLNQPMHQDGEFSSSLYVLS